MSGVNAAALYAEGQAILDGPDPGRGLVRALGLIDAAAAGGHADAIERRALFECSGLGRPIDWNRALDSLTAAAELGSRSAARQLTLLADGRFEASAPKSRDWAEMRTRIATADLFKERGGRVLSPEPLVVTLQEIADAAERQWLIASAKPRLQRAMLYTNPPRPDPGRTNQSAWFTIQHLDLVVELVRARIAAAIGVPLPFLEIAQVLHYNPGDTFGLHCDFLTPEKMAAQIAQAGQRRTTVIVYLNDDYEGGETSFPDLGISHRGRAGDALAFTNVDRGGLPDLRTKHAGMPPTRGEKWVFSQWVRDRAPG